MKRIFVFIVVSFILVISAFASIKYTIVKDMKAKTMVIFDGQKEVAKYEFKDANWVLASGNDIQLKIKGKVKLKNIEESGIVLYGIVKLNKGRINGKAIFYYKDFDSGLKEMEVTLKNGVPEGKVKRYHMNGKLWQVFTMKDGKYEGQHKTYNPNGVLGFVSNYNNGEKHGVQKGFFMNKDKTLMYEFNFENDLKVGEQRTYSSEGYLSNVMFYKDGSKISDISYYGNGEVSREYIYDKENLQVESRFYDDKGELIKTEHLERTKEQFERETQSF